MTKPARYDRIAFVASPSSEAQAAFGQLTRDFGNCDPKDASAHAHG
jgi:NAD+ kinase